MTPTAKQNMIDDILAGRPPRAFDIVDCHGHLGYWRGFNIAAPTPADLVRIMDRSGINTIVLSATAGITADYRLGNAQVLQAMRDFPGRIYGYCSINPHYPVQEQRDELARCLKTGMVGVKIHPSLHGYPAGGEGYRAAWEFAQEHNLCLLSHTCVGDPTCAIALFDQLAADYSAVKIILGHSGMGYEGTEQSAALARKYPNVYLDLTMSQCHRGLVERMVAGAGADRVLFGTDLQFIDCRTHLGRLAFSSLDDHALRLIFGANARRLFGLPALVK
jgi:uncharacterized protein